MSSRDVVALIRQTGKRHGADAAVELLEALCDVEARGRTDVTSAAALTDRALRCTRARGRDVRTPC